MYSALARGMPAPKSIPTDFYEILKYIWWNLDKNLDLEMIRASALATAMDCAKNGVTFVFDHHASPFAVKGSLETIAKAFDEIGVGHLLCYELSDRDGEESKNNGLDETENYLQNIQGLVGLHASFTVSNELLIAAADLATKYDSGIHIHVAEDPVDQDYCFREHGTRVIDRLNNYGVLDYEKTILAHCIHLDKNERSILENSKAWIAVNTESNLNNQVGLFTANGIPEVRIMLGTDGMHSDMIRSAQWHFFTHKKHEQLTIPQAYQRLRRVHYYLAANKFSGDGDNNLVIFNYDSPTPVTPENWLGHFFYGLNSSHVHSVISNGRLIVENRKLLTADENEILQFSREQAICLWRKLK